MIFDLPVTLSFGGRSWPIHSDYRDVLRTLSAFEDPDITDEEKAYICLHNLYPDFEDIPPEDLQAAFDAAIAFIDHGNDDPGGPRAACPRISDSGQAVFAKGENCPPNSEGFGRATRPRTMDWAQDAPLIFPAVNRAAGLEVRSVEYMHWWTFLGFFMEIRDTTYATVLGLRQKKYGKHRKKLEKHEQEFWKNNRSICELKTRYTEEDLAEQEALSRLLGG